MVRIKRYSGINERKEDLTEKRVKLFILDFCKLYNFNIFDFEYSYYKVTNKFVISFMIKTIIENRTEKFFSDMIDLLKTQEEWSIYPVMNSFKFLFITSNIEDFFVEVESRVKSKNYNL